MSLKNAISSGETRRLTEFLLADIVAIAADAIICIDADQNITLFNDGAEPIVGGTADEIMGKPLNLLLPKRFRAGHGAHIATFGRSKEHARRMGQRREI